MKRCTSSREVREKLVEILCSAGKPLTFDELYDAVRDACGDVGKFVVRKALGGLVREGVVERVRGDDVRGVPRMVFRCAGGSAGG